MTNNRSNKKIILIIMLPFVLFCGFFIVLGFLLQIELEGTNTGYGRDTVVYLNNKCQISSVFSVDLNCTTLGTLVENVYKYKIDKDNNTVYVIGKKEDKDVYGILNYETLRFISYRDIDYSTPSEKKVFINIKKFKNIKQ